MSQIWNTSALTPEHREIVEEFDRRSKFDFDQLLPGLQAQFGTQRTGIPIEFVDLTRYRGARASGDGHDHDHGDAGVAEGVTHGHGVDPETGEEGHGIYFREQALGLAWYSGKVSIEVSLPRHQQLEVLAAEGAHMIDFFWMTDEDRAAIAAALHPDGNWQHDDHGWFEERGEQSYGAWPGENFMDLFIRSATDIPLTLVLHWEHPNTDHAIEVTRQRLSRGFKPEPTPTPSPTPEPASEPEDAPQGEIVAWGHTKSEVYHVYDHLKNLDKDTAPLQWSSEDEAVAIGGRRICRTCLSIRNKRG